MKSIIESDRPARDRFCALAAAIPRHGVGLSVDLYSPDLYQLLATLSDHGLAVDYLEVFKARASDLAALRWHAPPSLRLAYHADGLWFCQPEFMDAYPWRAQVELIRHHTAVLDSAWATHECATKQMAGYAFGTYLPPILSDESADCAGRNAQAVQELLGARPLLLAEIPPFYFCVPGPMDLADFFTRLCSACDCGLLFDVGHLYTYYLYHGRPREPGGFLRDFLARFPLERVIQIHLAGLDGPAPPDGTAFLDDHGAAIPAFLFDWLETLLTQPRLTHLKGVALEVDTKSIEAILRDYPRFCAIARGWSERVGAPAA